MPLAWNELLGRSARRRKCTLTTLRAVRRLISARRGGKAAFVLLTNAEFDDALRSAGVRDVGVTFARTHPPELGGLWAPAFTKCSEMQMSRYCGPTTKLTCANEA